MKAFSSSPVRAGAGPPYAGDMTGHGRTRITVGDVLQAFGTLGLAAVLLVAGVGHFVETGEFLAQVPPWFPARDAVVIVSGVVELALGTALLTARGTWRRRTGLVVAGFFVVVLPGNISQLATGTDGFGLDTDLARALRLLFQPVLVVWALWATGVLAHWRASRPRHATR